jgi:molecular chaperone DnaK
MAKAGVPKIETTMTIDANGILSVSSKDLSTGRSANITIRDRSGLTEAEIERMIKDG